MPDKRDLLIEIGTEELPPKSLVLLATRFAGEIIAGLDENNLKHGVSRWYGTPRRLAVVVEKVALKQVDFEQKKRGPARDKSFDEDGNPTRALEGFAASAGISISMVDFEPNDKGIEYATSTQQVSGNYTADLLQDIINNALQRLPIARRMRWGTNRQAFVRPVHWSVVLLGREVVSCEIMGTTSSNESPGHRFHHPRPVRITSARTYASKLADKAFVIADFNERRERIRQMTNAAAAGNGFRAEIDPDLLEEVTSLVEWPIALTGTFDRKFLELPPEVLVSTLQEHQKYFPLKDNDGNFAAGFITIANIDSKLPDEVRKGNERVILPRLSDAAFFWRQDTRKPLSDYRDGLKAVLYQNKLGTLADRAERISTLAVSIASTLGLDSGTIERAALLSKCDLLTDMVGEFPKLQGVMGGYYASQGGEPIAVATAIAEQYMPVASGSTLPSSRAGQVLALADKLDTIAGLFSIGQQPGGDKDPFGLRRAALGIVRILIEKKINLELHEVIDLAARLNNPQVRTGNDIMKFIHERLAGYMKGQGYTQLEVDAVMYRSPANMVDVPELLHAVRSFMQLPEAESLVAANKRVANILRQAEEKGESFSRTDAMKLKEPEELQLVEVLRTASAQADAFILDKDFTGYLKCFAVLKDPVDRFFDTVMVMVEDESLRRERLSLLNDLRTAMNRVADISLLQA